LESAVWSVTKTDIGLADVNICPCFSLINLVDQAGSKKSYFWPNGVDTAFYNNNKEDRELAKKLGLSSNTIVFFGVLEPWLEFETVLKGLSIVAQDLPDVKLLIVGSSIMGYTQQLRKMILKLGLADRVHITGYVPTSLLPFYLNLGAFFIMPYATDKYSGKIRLPLKLFIYSALGKPILSVPLPEVMRLNPRHVFYYKDAEAFATTAKMILRNQALRKELGSYAREFSKKFDYQVLAQNLEKILVENLQTKQLK
jgi:glycosyltransferase involved in cell wall biosynthesis